MVKVIEMQDDIKILYDVILRFLLISFGSIMFVIGLFTLFGLTKITSMILTSLLTSAGILLFFLGFNNKIFDKYIYKPLDKFFLVKKQIKGD